MLVIPVPDELVADEVASRLERVFGFAVASVCLRCERDVERIADVAMIAFARAQPETFAVRVRRRDKSFPLTSQQLEREIGAALQARTALPVNLSRPGAGAARRARRRRGVRARARDRGRGRAAGRHQRSRRHAPVGRHRLARRRAAGDEARPRSVDYLHFSGEPYLDPRATSKAQAQARVLNGFQAARPGVLWVVPFGNQQRMLSAVSNESHRIVLYRRQMARVGCALARAAGRGGARHRRLARPGLLADPAEHDLGRRRVRAARAAPAARVGQAGGDGEGRRARDPVAVRAARR